MRYAIEYCQNQEYASIHVTEELPEWYRWIRSDRKETKEATALKVKVNSIPGVIESDSYDLHVRVKRGGAFSWSEIIQPLLEVIREHVGCEEMELVEFCR